MKSFWNNVTTFWNASSSYRAHVLPFLAFGLLTYAGSETLSPHAPYLMYPIKTICVGAILFAYRRSYPELRLHFSWTAFLVGVLVFIIWILPEGMYPLLSESSGFNPFRYQTSSLSLLLIIFRLIGAVLVVPVMEEIFWRSFALRWLIDENFTHVAIGTFTWFSCCVIVLGFGLEHHRWLVGLLAGILYNGLLYYKKDLGSCVLAHAVTNLLLGIYVLITHQWTFW